MILTQLFEVFSTKMERKFFEIFFGPKSNRHGPKMALFPGKNVTFWVGHKIAVEHRKCPDFDVFRLISSRYFPTNR